MVEMIGARRIDHMYVTATTAGYARMTANAYRHLAKFGEHLVVYCLDRDAEAELSKFGIPSRPLLSDSSCDAQLIYGTPEFKEICFRKLDVIKKALQRCDACTWLDGDVVTRRDPRNLIETILSQMKQQNIDIVMQNDSSSLDMDTSSRPTWLCAGLMILRNTERTLKLLTYPAELKKEWGHDQDYINECIRTQRYDIVTASASRESFPNGVFVNANAIPTNAVFVHYNWMVGEQKEHAMMKHGDWIMGHPQKKKIPTVELVVAWHGEDISWIIEYIDLVSKVTIYNKSSNDICDLVHPSICVETLRNIGREAHTYTSHFSKEYDELCDVIVCTQGSWKEHMSRDDFRSLFWGSEPPVEIGLDAKWNQTLMEVYGWCSEDDYGGTNMNSANMTLGSFFESHIKAKIVPESTIKWWKNAIFTVSRDQVHRHDIDTYTNLTRIFSTQNDELSHYMERFWRALFLDVPRIPPITNQNPVGSQQLK
jgi:hypothetical protein